MQRKKIQKILHAEKIAAGEVVDRPANIVKELVENAIDANATEIKIIVKKAGKTLIQVIDNGIGIAPGEVEYAFERHTSSKIRSIDDLDNLSTLGFRGEALASIAVVSQVEIISRTEENEQGVFLSIEGGKIKEKKEIACPIGTNIKIKNIFFNIPARQKFLKTDATELGHISDIIQRYSLAYPERQFIYSHNDLKILNCPAENDLKTTVFHIYGKNIAKFVEAIEFSEKEPLFKISGLIGHPQIAKKSGTTSSLFINKRYIISDLLKRAIQDAYKGTLMIGKHPFFVLFLELNPSFIDFNVHPKKLHVRFEREDYIYNKIYNVIRSFVGEKFIQKEEKYIATEISSYIPTEPINLKATESVTPTKSEKPIKEIREKKLVEVIIIEPIQTKLTEHTEIEDKSNSTVPESLLREKIIRVENFPKLRLISSTGQLSNKVYVVLEGEDDNDEPGLYILDQHAASERVNKEYFLNKFEKSKKVKQKLISPLTIELTPSEKYFLSENLDEFKKLGFDLDTFGGNSFVLREIPTIFGKIPDINIIKEMVSDIVEIGKDKSFSEVKEQIINYLSCHNSIRGGDDLTLKDIRNLLVDLSTCEDSYHCAHGRPTLRFLSFKELDKLFKRII